MSYASRLVAMSRGHAPQAAARVIGGEAEAPREEHVETELRAPPSAVAAPPREVARAAAHDQSEPEPVGRAPQRAREEEGTATRRITTEHHTVEHRELVTNQTVIEAQAPLQDPVRLPPSAQWLEEDRSAQDPLVASAETDALRELMQRVRQWTTSAPTVIEAAKPSSPAADPVATIPAPEPTHVSIGNVVITVEDAPVARPRGERAPSPARTTTDRMARNHIRGG